MDSLWGGGGFYYSFYYKIINNFNYINIDFSSFFIWEIIVFLII